MPFKDAEAKLVRELKLALGAEQQGETALRELAEQVEDPGLRQALTTHADETAQQATLLQEGLAALGNKGQRMPKNLAVDGAVRQLRALMKEADGQGLLRDCVIAAELAKIEAAETQTYSGLLNAAQTLQVQPLIEALQTIHQQEVNTAALMAQQETQLAQRALQEQPGARMKRQLKNAQGRTPAAPPAQSAQPAPAARPGAPITLDQVG